MILAGRFAGFGALCCTLRWMSRTPAEIWKMAAHVRRTPPPRRGTKPRLVDGVYYDTFGVSFRQLMTEIYAEERRPVVRLLD